LFAPTSCARLVFVSNRAGAQHIWRLDIDGRNPTKLSDGQRGLYPHCSPDGRWVFYTSTINGKQRVTRVPIEGGESVPLTDYTSGGPVVSPDGKQIACGSFDEKEARWKVVIIPVEGGPPVKTFDINVWPVKLRWRPDGRSLTYAQRRAGVANLWSQPIDGGKPAQLTDFKADEILFFDWSRDGRQLVLARANVNNDIVLISDSR
jgi:Tol biopolymer transport system component